MDFRAALVLEDSLEYNKCLRELDVSNNSLGNAGMRSLLRVLARDTSGLQCVIYENCAKGIVVNARSDMVFRASRPHGRYDLDLTRPYDRSLLRMLYKTADRLDMPFDQTFREVSNLQHPPKSSNGLYQVPSTGKAALTFTMDKVLEDKTSRKMLKTLKMLLYRESLGAGVVGATRNSTGCCAAIPSSSVCGRNGRW